MPKKLKIQKTKLGINQLARINALSAYAVNNEARKLEEALRADEFMRVYLRIADIHESLGEPFVTKTPEGPAYNLEASPRWLANRLCNYSERANKEATSRVPTIVAQDIATFAQRRTEAMASTTRVVALWEKDGIPVKEVWAILQRINPHRKRWVATMAIYHEMLVSMIEAYREACFNLCELNHPDTAFIIFPSQLREQIAKGSIEGMVACTQARAKMEEGSRIIKAAKRQHVDVRNPIQEAVKQRLVNLRKQYVKETPAKTSQMTAQILNAWDPADAEAKKPKWNASSIRANQVY
jgi:hypothetical protein